MQLAANVGALTSIAIRLGIMFRDGSLVAIANSSDACHPPWQLLDHTLVAGGRKS